MSNTYMYQVSYMNVRSDTAEVQRLIRMDTNLIHINPQEK